MAVSLRERWKALEDRAIASGTFFQMTAAGRSLGETMDALIARHARGVVLDAGAGRLAHRTALTGNPRVTRYVSIDYGASHGELSAVADLLSGLPFPDEAFDTVVCSQVLEHVPEPQAALAEITRVLAPGGTLLLSAPHLTFVHGAPEDYYRYTPY